MKFLAPLYVAWEITHHCNARCLHCYSNSSPESSKANDLDTQEALRVIDQLADAGLMVLAFSGGEPLLRPDWPTLARHAKERGLVVNFGSNGTCITPKIADRIAQLGVDSMTISIDSHIPQVHDNFRGVIGLHEKAVKAIRLLRQREVRVVVGFTPTAINWHHGSEVALLALQLRASAVNLSEYVPAGRGSRELALTPDQLHQTLQKWIAMRKTLAGQIDVIWHDCRVGLLLSDEEKRDYVGCGAGRLVGRILPDGTVTPCVFLPTPIGSLRKETFAMLWSKSALMGQFRERNQITGNCGECEYLHVCGGCRAVAYAYSNGDPLAGDPHCWIKLSNQQKASSLVDGELLSIQGEIP